MSICEYYFEDEFWKINIRSQQSFQTGLGPPLCLCHFLTEALMELDQTIDWETKSKRLNLFTSCFWFYLICYIGSGLIGILIYLILFSIKANLNNSVHAIIRLSIHTHMSAIMPFRNISIFAVGKMVRGVLIWRLFHFIKVSNFVN